MKKRGIREKVPGYFTVEAVFIMPFVLWGILFVIYLQFFLYNRCCMEQETARLVLRGAAIQISDKEEKLREWSRQASSFGTDPYLAWEKGDWKLRMEQDKAAAECSGILLFPFTDWGLGGDEYWSARVRYENRIVKPVSFIRTWRMVKGLIEKGEK